VEGYNSDWKLDLQGGFASLAKPTETMKEYKVPLAPMLGCVGVAPQGGMRYRSGFLGSYGGNMDYNQLREGITVYLPVYVPGALLFVGDGHAAQGAGELTGNALETSMDIEFTVEVQAGGAPPNPRMENADYLVASGIAGSIDEAFRSATTNLVRWLERMYGLNAAEVSSVLGTAMVYDIAEVVDSQPHVVAKVPKSVLAALKRQRSSPEAGARAMAVSFETVRKLGLQLPDVEEGMGYGKPALKVCGKMFACLPSHKSAEPDSLVVRTDFEQRTELLSADPDVYDITDHYRDYPAVLVRMSRITPDMLQESTRHGIPLRFV
jgi:hypothetical protein